MLKPILAILGGLAAAFGIVFASDSLFYVLAPSAATPADPAAMAAYVAGQPTAVLAALVAGWTVAAFTGAWIAARFAGRGVWPGLLAGGLFLAATVANFLFVEHPLWMVVMGCALISVAAWAGARSGAPKLRRRAI